ncbi:hypothetical protein H1O16_gp396 [Burkholderia phage BcepSaruman]|nr:hypothetical protein H1O16_gp396 [Burkholderia phage BcepSaruman]QBX06809.1 hypothetical protein BcepSaruman_396 [Burkholderia phage BcepSaruman]
MRDTYYRILEKARDLIETDSVMLVCTAIRIAGNHLNAPDAAEVLRTHVTQILRNCTRTPEDQPVVLDDFVRLCTGHQRLDKRDMKETRVQWLTYMMENWA